MAKIDPDQYIDQNFEQTFETRHERREKLHYKKGHAPRGRDERMEYVADLLEHAEKAPVDVAQHFAPTFSSSGHEQYWILNYLEPFYLDHVITDVLGKVKGGKEANVYCCSAHASTGLSLVAAKIYRPRMFRNLRNDSRYRLGRDTRDEGGKVLRSRREMLAIAKNTRFGQELRHATWLETEYRALRHLSAAGADVPKPVARGSNVILMEYVGGGSAAAQTLNHVNLTRAEAETIFARLIENLGIMLENHLVHADLSAYNVLYWEGEFKIIDFPQAVDPRRNAEAGEMFERDVTRLCQYFSRYGIRRDPRSLSGELWERYERLNALDAGIIIEDE